MALTAGGWNITGSVSISGALIAPQGNAADNTLQSPSNSQSQSGSQIIGFGTAAGECDVYCAGQWTLAAASDMEFDLFAGGVKDVFGFDAELENLKGIFVSIEAGGDSAGLTIGGAATNATPLWFDAADNTWTIYPDGPPFMGGSSDGIAVDASNTNLLITNNGAAEVTFNLFLAGVRV